MTLCDVNFNDLVKVMCTGFLHAIFPIFLFVVSKEFVGRHSEIIKLSSTNVASTEDLLIP